MNFVKVKQGYFIEKKTCKKDVRGEKGNVVKREHYRLDFSRVEIKKKKPQNKQDIYIQEKIWA